MHLQGQVASLAEIKTYRASNSVRRRNSKRLNIRRKLLPGERKHVEEQIAILRISGYNNTQIAKVTGVSRGQVKEILEDAGVIELVNELRLVLTKAASNLLEHSLIEAVQALVNVMRTSTDEQNVIKAAGEILDRGGLPKLSRQEQRREVETRTTFTDDGIVDALRMLPPEQQEEAAQMIEGLQKMLNRAIEGDDGASPSS
jgi:hypothetical protein